MSSSGNWVVVWYEHQPVLAVDANSVLLVAVLSELAPPDVID